MVDGGEAFVRELQTKAGLNVVAPLCFPLTTVYTMGNLLGKDDVIVQQAVLQIDPRGIMTLIPPAHGLVKEATYVLEKVRLQLDGIVYVPGSLSQLYPTCQAYCSPSQQGGADRNGTPQSLACVKLCNVELKATNPRDSCNCALYKRIVCYPGTGKGEGLVCYQSKQQIVQESDDPSTKRCLGPCSSQLYSF